jgi:hypothetical protein
MTAIAVYVNLENLEDIHKQVDRVVRAHDEENAHLKLTKFQSKGNDEYFLIYERTPQFHDWYNVKLATEKSFQGETTTYTITKVPHMG